jgi:Zn-dependent peptidase ImmA (M78 family)
MPTALQAALARRSLGVDDLIRAGLPSSRAVELIEGADASVDELRRVASSFRIPIAALFSEALAELEGQVRLRENFRRDDGGEKLTEAYELLRRSRALADYIPASERADIWIDLPIEARSYTVAEDLAATCRGDILGVSADTPLIHLEMHAALKTSAFILTNQIARYIEGATISAAGKRFVFVAERNDPRMRFTLAHELCHYLVDVPPNVDTAWIDEDFDRPTRELRIAEFFANAFAAALLLPPTALGVTLQSFRQSKGIRGEGISDIEVMFLARYFGVNFQVAARRLEDLSLLPRGAGSALYEQLVREYRSPEQFAAAVGLPDRETIRWGFGLGILATAARSSLNNGAVSIGKLASEIGIGIEDLQRAAHL